MCSSSSPSPPAWKRMTSGGRSVGSVGLGWLTTTSVSFVFFKKTVLSQSVCLRERETDGRTDVPIPNPNRTEGRRWIGKKELGKKGTSNNFTRRRRRRRRRRRPSVNKTSEPKPTTMMRVVTRSLSVCTQYVLFPRGRIWKFSNQWNGSTHPLLQLTTCVRIAGQPVDSSHGR